MSLWLKIGLGVFLIALIVTGFYAYSDHMYTVGFTNGVNSATAKQNNDVNTENRAEIAQKNQLQDYLSLQTGKFQALSTQNDVTTAAATTIITKVIHDNPTFARCTRPDDLVSLRRQRVEAYNAIVHGEFPSTAGTSAVALPAAVGGPKQ
jgi:hypothetical protein